MTQARPASPPPRVASKADAEALTADVLACLAELERVLEAETAHVRAGRIREGLADEAARGALGPLRAGAGDPQVQRVALARFAPDRLDALKSAHARFAKVVEANQVVLATARAVSESLVKGIAEELGRGQRAQGYAPAGYGAPQPRSPQGEPLVVSRSL
jgi:hypothetical protein